MFSHQGNEAFPTPSPVSYRAAAAALPHPHPLGVEKMQQSVSGRGMIWWFPF
jgi:hypothetical protein